MSCVTVVGRSRVVPEGCDDRFQWLRPTWTQSKALRLEQQALAANPAVRAVAAAHPKTRPALLWGLLQDEDLAVRRAAVKNPRIDTRMLRAATADPDPGIRAYAAMLLGL